LPNFCYTIYNENRDENILELELCQSMPTRTNPVPYTDFTAVSRWTWAIQVHPEGLILKIHLKKLDSEKFISSSSCPFP
jgi:hypothetical protein